MSKRVWVFGLVIVLFGGAVRWLVTRPNCRELTFGDVVILGHLNWLGERADYFSLRLKGVEAAPSFIIVNGRRLALSGVTSGELQEAGFQQSANRDGGRRFYSVGYGDENRDGSIEFLFQELALSDVYVRCHQANACAFSIGWEGGQSFSLPVDEAHLLSRLPRTPKARDFFAH